MKRLHLTLIVALFLCTIAYANEKDIKVGGFHYRILNDNEVAVIGTEINDTVIRIPSTVSITNKQYAVVEIANKKPEKEGKNWAYYKNQDWGASTKDIIIPQSVKKLEQERSIIILFGILDYLKKWSIFRHMLFIIAK